MDDRPADQPRIDLAAATRIARAQDAERSAAIADLRALALARLGVLRDALHPVLAQVPPDVDLFDVGLMPGDPPRLFIDMVGFVELARDRRDFRLYQDRRHGRTLLAEAATLDDAVEAVTLYIARRLVERDKAFLSDDLPPPLTPTRTRPAARTDGSERRVWRGLKTLDWSMAGQVFWFVVEVLGLLALFGLLLIGLRGMVEAVLSR